MENDKLAYYSLKEDISVLTKLAKQIDTICEIIDIYGVNAIKDMSIIDVKDFLEDRYSKIDNEAFIKFNSNKYTWILNKK